MGETVTVRFLVAGRVQGVFYRASTQSQAQVLGLAGWARNLPDGRVEVLARGLRDQVEVLERWLRQGPPLAHVESVLREEVADAADCPQPFAIRR
jgi:acylphosphatase